MMAFRSCPEQSVREWPRFWPFSVLERRRYDRRLSEPEPWLNLMILQVKFVQELEEFCVGVSSIAKNVHIYRGMTSRKEEQLVCCFSMCGMWVGSMVMQFLIFWPCIMPFLTTFWFSYFFYFNFLIIDARISVHSKRFQTLISALVSNQSTGLRILNLKGVQCFDFSEQVFVECVCCYIMALEIIIRVLI